MPKASSRGCGWPTNRSRIGSESDTILEFGLGLTQSQKLAQLVRIAQVL